MNSRIFQNLSTTNGSIQVLGTSGPVNINLTHASTRVAEASPPPYYHIPALPVSQFIERPELMKQLEKSLQKGNAPQRVVLLGMGGQGKSQLALEVCRRRRVSGEVKAVLWIDASSDSSIQRSFEIISAKVTGTSQVFDDLVVGIASVKDVIEKWTFSWVLVFDNYDLPNKTMNIASCFPRSGHGQVIITSRHEGSKRLGSVVNVDGMNEDESLQLLFHRSELSITDANREEACEIIKQLGHHPLAIDQAGSYISSRSMLMSAFLKEFNKRKEHILQHRPALSEYRSAVDHGLDKTALNLFTTLELSLRSLPADTKEAIDASLTLSAFFNTSRVGEDLFMIGSRIGAPLWKKLFLTFEEWDHYKYRDLVLSLQQASLLQSIPSEDITYFSFHPLVADWLRLRRGKSSRQANVVQCCSIVYHHLESVDDSLSPMKFEDQQYWLTNAKACIINQLAYRAPGLDLDRAMNQQLRMLWFFAECSMGGGSSDIELQMVEESQRLFSPD